MALWNIIQYSIGSLVWCVLIAVLCMALFILIVKGWFKDAMFSIWSYIIGIILFVLHKTIYNFFKHSFWLFNLKNVKLPLDKSPTCDII